MVEPHRYSEELIIKAVLIAPLKPSSVNAREHRWVRAPSGNSRKIAFAHSKDVAQVHKIGSQSRALWFTQMECLEINLTSLSRQHSRFCGAGSSIKASGALRLFSFCSGLRSWSSWPVPRYVPSAKTPQRSRRARRNDAPRETAWASNRNSTGRKHRV